MLMLVGSFSARSAERSLLSEGRWVKIAVDTTGVHFLPEEMLESLGFNNIDRLTVAGYGSVERAHSLDTAPDDLPILPVRRTPDGVYFMAEGDMRLIPSEASLTVHRNHYSRGSYYYIGIREGISSPELSLHEPDVTSGRSGHRLDTHLSVDHRDFIEDRPFFHVLYSFTRNFAESDYTVTFDLTDNAGEQEWLHSAIAWYVPSNGGSCNLSFSQGVTADVTSVALKRNNTVANAIYSVLESRSVLSHGGPTTALSVTYSRENAGVTSYLALRSASLVYHRLNKGASPTGMMHFPSLNTNDSVAISDLPTGAEVWDVTSPRSPRRLLATPCDKDQTTHIVIPGLSGRCALIAFDPASADLPVPRVTGEVANQSLHSMADADMLIVTTGYTHRAALRLAEAHETLQGLKVAVVDQQTIFEEFSSGAMHPNGLRAMVKMLHNRPDKLRYLLLMGQGSSDTRRDLDRSDFEALVTYCTEDYSENGNENKCSSPDFYFGITSEGTILPSLARTALGADVSVGRIAVNNAEDADTYVDKCIDYLSDPRRAGTLGHALLSACYGNNTQHILAAENIGVYTISTLMPGATLSRSYMDFFPLSSEYVAPLCRDHFMSTLSMGPRAMFYLGHGEYNAIILNTFSTSDHLLSTYGSLPVCILGCCLVNDINLDRQSIGDKMISTNPGPICVIAPGSSVLLSYNVVFVRAVAEMLFSGKAATLGDVYRLASNSFMEMDTHYQRTNNLCYNFTGDPALPTYSPTRSAVVTSLDGSTIDSNAAVGLYAPGDKVTLEGAIVTPEGEIDTEFNGSIDIIIYDGASTRVSLNHENSSDHRNDLYTIDETVADRYSTAVTDGHWKLTMTLPAVMHKAESNRLFMSAYSTSGITATGSSQTICIDPVLSPADNHTADTSAPEAEIWLENPDFISGTEVSTSPLLHIELHDNGSGPYLGYAVPGSSPTVRLDGKSLPQVARLFSPRPDGTASLDYRLPDLSGGRHTVSTSAFDRAGNRVDHEVSFTVVTTTPSTLSASTHIARNNVTFELSHPFDLTDSSKFETSRLYIRDLSGNPVLMVDHPSYPYTWNLRDREGNPVADGTYRISATLSSPPFYTASPEISVTVVH